MPLVFGISGFPFAVKDVQAFYCDMCMCVYMHQWL